VNYFGCHGTKQHASDESCAMGTNQDTVAVQLSGTSHDGFCVIKPMR